MSWMQDLQTVDSAVYDIIEAELNRQRHKLELIASENIVSKAVMAAQGSVLTNKYGASWDSVARLFMYNLPEIINYTFPMSMLLASLMAFGKLSGNTNFAFAA